MSVHVASFLQLKYRNQVIIMELCTGGSLYEVIDSPDNAYGLSETEFKQVIYDVGECMSPYCTHTYNHYVGIYLPVLPTYV